VKKHDGNIWVYSEPGKGTTFKIYLPMVEEEAVARRRPEAPRKTTAGTETILIVEDEDAVRKLARRILTKNGYTVHTAASAEEAQDVLRRVGDDVTLLLTDIVLPGLNGRELYEAETGRYPSMKVLYMSGYAANAISHNGILDEGAPLLQKPFTPEALALRVREVIESD